MEVNQQSFPDLYFALRGGGNNFGIVTRFDLETFPQGNMWGGMRKYPITANVSILAALSNFTNSGPSNPDAALIVAFVNFEGNYLISTDMEYAKPVVNPPIFNEFMAIESLASTMRITNLTDLTGELELANPSGFREFYTTATFKNSAVLQKKILDVFVAEIEEVKDAEGILPALVMQPITQDVIAHFNKNGGNALGIVESDGPLMRKFSATAMKRVCWGPSPTPTVWLMLFLSSSGQHRHHVVIRSGRRTYRRRRQPGHR